MVEHATSLTWSVCATAQVILSVLAHQYDWSVDVHETFIQTSPLPAVTNGMPMKCWTKANLFNQEQNLQLLIKLMVT